MMKTESETERYRTAVSENGERILECEHPLGVEKIRDQILP